MNKSILVIILAIAPLTLHAGNKKFNSSSNAPAKTPFRCKVPVVKNFFPSCQANEIKRNSPALPQPASR